MTRKITSILFMSAILLTSAIAASIPMMQDADAYQSSGTSVKEVGSGKVCGDRLCSEYEGGRAEYEAKKDAATKAIGETIADLERDATSADKRIS